jgi:pSer/pThr/pTyr-binding forkhead associated (FHA) protein
VFIKYEGESVELSPGETLIGRDLSCRLRFNDPSISRRHLRVLLAGDLIRIEDLCSSNGSFINGRAIPQHQPQEVVDGDIVKIGSCTLTVQVVGDDVAIEPEPKTLLDVPQVRAAAITMPMSALPPVASVSQFQQCPRCKGNVNVEDDACAHCGYSWSDFRPHSSTKVGPNPLDRRRHKRHLIETPILYSSDTLEVETVALDLSLSGVFVSTEILDPEDTTCTLTIMVDGGPPVVLKGHVRRVVSRRNKEDDRPPGIGIEFTEVSDHARRWLETTIARAAA